MNKTTVLLAEDHTVVRQGLRALLESEGRVEIVGEAADGREAVRLARQYLPAVVLMDIAMPRLNGFDATRRIVESGSKTRILILSAHDDDAYVDKALAVGALGYLLKHISLDILSEGIEEVAKSHPFFSPLISTRLSERNRNLPNHAGNLRKKHVDLSPRESETLQLIAEGNPNKRIAADLRISIKTVEKHRHRLMEKLDIHDTATLTRYALANGIIEGGGRLGAVE